MSKARKLLVVDDDDGLLEEVKLCLEDEGYAVTTAPNGKRAIAELEQQKFDLLLSDVRMPNGDGKFLLQWLREGDPATPFIFMTGFADINERTAKELGATALFDKPLAIDQLLDAIEDMFDAQ